jgi:hypothetical protein
MTRIAVPSKESQLLVVGPKNSFKASRVQRVNMNSDVPNTTIDELGSSSHAGVTKDTPNVTVSFEAFDVGIKIFAALTGNDPDSYPAGGVDVVNLGEFDAILYYKDEVVSDYAKCIHARKLQVQSASYSFSLDGEASESYNAAGSEKRSLRYDAVVERFTTGTTSFTLVATPMQLKNGNYALSVIMDGIYLTEVTGAPAAGQYRIVGQTLTTGTSRVAQVMVVLHANPAGTNWTDVSDPLLPAGIRGKDVVVKIAANQISRVQSVTINANLNPTPVREMGNKSGIAGYQRQVPEVDGTITVLETDNELINLLLYGTTVLSGVEWEIGKGCAGETVGLTIELLDPCDDTAPYEVLKTYVIDSLDITGDSHVAAVNSNLQVTYNWKSKTGHLVVYSGAVA